MDRFTYTRRTEIVVEIPIPDTKLHINGVLRGNWSQPVVVLLHGLPGASYDLLEFLGAKYLTEQGFATLRISLYDDSEKTRNLVDCTLQTHADDLDVIVEYLRADKHTPQVFATGHSYGGLAILRSTAHLDGAALWDPSSFAFSAAWDKGLDKTPRLRLPKQRIMLYTDGTPYINPLTMIEERIAYDGDDHLWTRKDYPMLFVAAGKGVLIPYIKEYLELANEPKKLVVIKDASHSFTDSDDILFELLAETHNWFKQCL
jgi:pimeloyl-ACP methyl ester carboxylesterase